MHCRKTVSLPRLATVKLRIRYFSKQTGSFWAVYVCGDQQQLQVFAVSDTVGVFPMWMACEDEFLLLSPYWPSKLVPLAAAPHRWRQACPRLMHRWSSLDGLEASMPDNFYGLHGKVENGMEKTGEEELTLHLREALIQAVQRCIVGEDHVGLLFSGGLDSGLLAWLFTEKLAPCKCSCYTVGFHMDDKKIKNKQLDFRVFLVFQFHRTCSNPVVGLLNHKPLLDLIPLQSDFAC